MVDIKNCNCIDFLKETNLSNLCIVTDPPFNIGYHYNSYEDNMTWGGYVEMLNEITKDKPFVMIHYPEYLYRILSEIGRHPNKVVSWVYNSNTAKQHRDIVFVDVKPDFRKVRQPYKNPNDKRIQERIKRGITGGRLYDWWNINQVKNVSKVKTNHPCQMPLEVMENIIGIIPEEYTIFDPFMGSGTTGVACKKLGRNFVGTEIDPIYFEIAKERINGIH